MLPGLRTNLTLERGRTNSNHQPRKAEEMYWTKILSETLWILGLLTLHSCTFREKANSFPTRKNPIAGLIIICQL